MHPPRAAVAKDLADDLSADPVDRQPIPMIISLKSMRPRPPTRDCTRFSNSAAVLPAALFTLGARVVDQSSEIRHNVIEGAAGFRAYALCRKGADDGFDILGPFRGARRVTAAAEVRSKRPLTLRQRAAARDDVTSRCCVHCLLPMLRSDLSTVGDF